ncbi:MAG TPA: hypothetical protein PKA05_18080, partial [Roseiflexaceae bacterium]|nr:hypothetical protein [Roseiflexaceae bacterium]
MTTRAEQPAVPVPSLRGMLHAGAADLLLALLLMGIAALLLMRPLEQQLALTIGASDAQHQWR